MDEFRLEEPFISVFCDCDRNSVPYRYLEETAHYLRKQVEDEYGEGYTFAADVSYAQAKMAEVVYNVMIKDDSVYNRVATIYVLFALNDGRVFADGNPASIKIIRRTLHSGEGGPVPYTDLTVGLGDPNIDEKLYEMLKRRIDVEISRRPV